MVTQALPTPPPGGWTLSTFPQLKRTHIGRLTTEIPFPIDIPLEAPKP